MNPSFFRRGSAVIWLALVFAVPTVAQIEFDPVAGVPLKAAVSPDAVPAGGSGELVLTLELPPDIHITSRETGFFFVEPDTADGVRWGLTSFPAGVDFEGDTVYRGSVNLTTPFTIAADKSNGMVTLAGAVGYQICTEAEPIYCLPPVERRFEAQMEILPAGAAAPAGGMSGDTAGLTVEQRAMEALRSGSLMALLWVFIGGVLLSFTPCVYPVIPITVAYIGARSGGSKLKGFSLSLVFVLGLALVYSALGVIAAATGGVFGLSTQNRWVVGFVTLVFLVMGVGMLGAFEISLPASLQTKMSSGRRSGYLGALFVGGTTGLVAAPCVGPVLVALLSWVSSTGNLFAGFLYLFVFACGLGVLFVVIGTFAGVMAALPKAGGWMERVKQGFGVVLIAAAYYFGRPLVPQDWFILLVGLGLMLMGGMFGGYTRLEGDTGLGRRAGRALAGFVILVGGFYVLLALVRFEGLTLPGAAPPSGTAAATESSTGGEVQEGMDWIHDDETGAMEMAAQTGKPVLVDFWADWCAACRELDHRTFSDPEVYGFVNEHFVALKVDGSKITDELKATWQRYGVKGLPTVLLLTPAGEELARFEAFRTPQQVMPFLERVAAGTGG